MTMKIEEFLFRLDVQGLKQKGYFNCSLIVEVCYPYWF